MWTVEAYNPDKGWQKLPVTHKTETDALRGATWITLKYMVQTRVAMVERESRR